MYCTVVWCNGFAVVVASVGVVVAVVVVVGCCRWRCLLYWACRATCMFKTHTFPLRLPQKMTLERAKLSKLVRTCSVLTSFNFDMCFAPQLRALSRRVHFFDISTSHSGPNLRPFDHVRFEMCFAPQPRAFFEILLPKSGPNMRCF